MLGETDFLSFDGVPRIARKTAILAFERSVNAVVKCFCALAVWPDGWGGLSAISFPQQQS